jgi:PAS domain S-box-containing protein
MMAFTQIDRAAAAQERANRTIACATNLLSELKDAETGERGYVVTGNEAFLEPYLAVRDKVRADTGELESLSLEPEEKAKVTAIAPLIDGKMADLGRIIGLRRNHDEPGASAAVSSGYGKGLMDSIRVKIGSFISIEDGVRALQATEFEVEMRRLLSMILAVAGLTVLALLGFVFMLRRDLRQRLRSLARLENSQLIAGLGDWEYSFASCRMIWSDEIYRILGISREDFPPTVKVFDLQVHPEDAGIVEQTRTDGNEGLGRRDLDYRIIRPDGQVRHVHKITETICDGHGRPNMELGTIQDVTDIKVSEQALRQSEERFKFVARAVSDIVWDWDLAGGTFWWNDGFRSTFGFAAGEMEASVDSHTRRIHPEDRIRVEDGIREAIVGKAESWSADYRVQRKDSTYAHVRDRGYILRDAAGKAVRMVGGISDLSEEKEREAAYLSAQRMESIGSLASGIAHDLNNVFAPIMMSIDLLKMESDDEARRGRILATISASCRRGADLVRQVLTFARGIDGQVGTVALGRLISELQAIIEETFPRNIEIIIRVAADLWAISGNPTQLNQVLLNLSVNARDAMPRGGTLTISASNVVIDEELAGESQQTNVGPHVLLTVTDTGIGMTPEVRARIFELYFTTKGEGKGTGIGLATVQTVVRSHGGFLNVRSQVGRGTTFNAYFPADPALQAAGAVLATPRGRYWRPLGTASSPRATGPMRLRRMPAM